MATNLFTYSGPSVTAAFTAGMLNTSWDLALQKADETKLATDEAIAQAQNPVQITETGLIYSPALPTPPALVEFDPLQADARYQDYKNEISAYLTDHFQAFITTFYPSSAYLTYAQAWIERALTTGGTGLNSIVESQIWERDRARLARDNARAQDELRSAWASKGYPLPPGALVSQQQLLDADLRDKTAQASRDVAIRQAEIEIENIRFAVQQALNLRQQALNAALDFIRAMVLGPQVGAQVATSIADIQARMTQATTALYAAQVQATELPLRIAVTDAELRQRAKEANLRAAVEAQHDRVTVANGAAQSLSSVAAAAANALHSSVGIGGSEQI